MARKIKGLYFHIPFCIKKCNYCAFCSYEGVDDYEIAFYIEALSKEISYYYSFVEPPYTIYVGGGTPTFLKKTHLISFLNKINRFFPDPIEFTFEANPETVDKEKLLILKEYGVTRISLGIQSFDDRVLSFLGRVHNSYRAKMALDLVTAFFDNYSIDMIFGVSKDFVGVLEGDLKEVCLIKPPHVSYYGLTLEEGTPLKHFFDKNPELLVEEEDWEKMFMLIDGTFRGHGYHHYEVSNFAISDRYKCKHNLVYWNMRDYLGFGVSAASFYEGKRWNNTDNLRRYILDPVGSKVIEEEVKGAGYIKEQIMLTLRTSCGLSLKKKYMLPYRKKLLEFAKELEKEGIVVVDNERIKLTSKGYALSNSVIIKVWEYLGL